VQSEWEEKVSILLNKGKETEALPIVNKILEKKPNSKEALFFKAQIYDQHCDYTSALKTYQKVISLYEEREDLEKQAEIFGLIGELYNILDDVRNAIKNFSIMLEKIELIDEPLSDELKDLRALKLGDLASFAMENQNYEQALEYYQELIQAHQKSNMKRGLIEDYINVGDFYFTQKEYSNSKEYFSLALEECRKLKTQYIEPNIRYKLANVLVKMEEYDDAVKHLEIGLNLLKKFELKRPLFEKNNFEDYETITHLLSEIVLKMSREAFKLVQEGENNSARKLCEKLLPIIEKHKYQKVQAKVYYCMAKIALTKVDIKNAKIYLQQSIQALKRTNNYRKSELFSIIKSLLQDMKELQKEKE